MSIYKKLSKMVGYGSLEEKLYALLQTDTYKTDLYRTWDLGEGMAVLHKSMMGWYKPRFLLNHNKKTAIEFMDSDERLVTVTENDINWTSLKKLPEDAMVVADEERISQVISNLISNAVKYSFPSTYISLIFSVDRTKDTFLVQVHDEGPGVSDADSLHLFERFYRSKATSVTRSGRGLGLTLSREIINAHKGRIWVYNNKDRGCTFSFSLPLYKENLNV